jgi:SpoIID/LytB domain protein
MDRSDLAGTVARMSTKARRALAAITVALLAGTTGVGLAGPADAQSPTGLQVSGHGNGHGRGLGQWGAKGYADDRGWSTEQILAHYYGGTSGGGVDPGSPVRVLLCDQEGVTICGSGGGVASVVFTSGVDFRVEGVVVPAGTALRISREGNRFKNEVSTSGSGCGAGGFQPIAGDGYSFDATQNVDVTVGDPGDDKTKMLQVCSPKARYYRGTFEYTVSGGKARLVNYLGIDGYLKGVVPSEMPSSWNPAALRAQAVAARSYAMAGDTRHGTTAGNDRIDTCDTTQCQVYLGASNESANANAAIAATAGQIRRLGNGNIARTEFSSSTGGWTAEGTFPPVEDLGDATAGNPHHNWSLTLTDVQIEQALPTIGDLQRVDITERNRLGADGGRVRRMRVVGSSATRELTGDQFRSTFGLRSDWFSVSPVTSPGGGSPPTTAPAPSGSANVLGWLTRSTATPGAPTGNVAYGAPGYTAVTCDWNDDGTDTLGVYAGGTWYLRDDLNPGSPTRTFDYGAPGYRPVCGDWDGDGRDGIGVYANGTWYLRNDVGPGAPHYAFDYGYAAAVPVVGNFDPADLAVEIAVYDSGTWYERNDVGAGPPSSTFAYGYAGVPPVAGDWNGDGTDGIGVYDRGQWFLREAASPGGPERNFAYGYPGTSPVVGRWSAAVDGVGIIEVR